MCVCVCVCVRACVRACVLVCVCVCVCVCHKKTAYLNIILVNFVVVDDDIIAVVMVCFLFGLVWGIVLRTNLFGT